MISRNDITLIEGANIIQDDLELASRLNNFFSNAAASLSVEIPRECITEESSLNDDPINQITLKYSNHPNIKAIIKNVKMVNFLFMKYRWSI